MPPDGGDTTESTTMLAEGKDYIRWVYRPARAKERPTPSELLAAVNRELPAE